jgi:hypothetical protein
MEYEFDLGELEGPYTDAEGSQIVEFTLGTLAYCNVCAILQQIGDGHEANRTSRSFACGRPTSKVQQSWHYWYDQDAARKVG